MVKRLMDLNWRAGRRQPPGRLNVKRSSRTGGLTPPRSPGSSQVVSHRGGLALMVVLVALAIVSAIGMSLLKSAISQHRQAARDVLVVQARWLAESGIDRAAALLKADEKTAGFQWSVTAEQLGSRHAAKVTIEIKPVENAPQRRQIFAATEYPAESPKRIRTTVTRFVDL